MASNTAVVKPDEIEALRFLGGAHRGGFVRGKVDAACRHVDGKEMMLAVVAVGCCGRRGTFQVDLLVA